MTVIADMGDGETSPRDWELNRLQVTRGREGWQISISPTGDWCADRGTHHVKAPTAASLDKHLDEIRCGLYDRLAVLGGRVYSR